MATIHLIEDDLGTAEEILFELRQGGYQVVHFETGRPALAAIRDQPPDAIIVDRRLPDMEGLEIIETLRDEGIRVPGLVLSAMSSLNERVRGLRAGGGRLSVQTVRPGGTCRTYRSPATPTDQ